MANVMDKFTALCEKYLLPFGTKIASQRHLAAIRDGMAVLIPLTIIGGIACLLAVPPVPDGIEGTNIFYKFLLAWDSWATANSTMLMIPYQMTIGSLTLYVVAAVSYYLAKSYGYDGLSNAIVSLFVYLCVSDAVDIENSTLNFSMFGAGYMFGGLIVAIGCVEVVHLCEHYNIVIRLPEQVPPNVASPFKVLIPAAISTVGFMLINMAITAVSGAGLTSLIYTIFTPLISGSNTLGSCILLGFISSFFWFFGIHGDNLVSPITTPITTAALAANMEAYAAGAEIPYVWAGTLTTVFGGWMVCNAYQVVMKFFCKSARLTSLVKVSWVSSIFNINEPGVFGIPTVLNPSIALGNYLAGLFDTIVYWLLADAGIVGKQIISLPFTTPGIIAAFLATMDWKCVVLWIVLFVLDIIIILPFFRTYDKQLLKEEEEYAAQQAAEAAK